MFAQLKKGSIKMSKKYNINLKEMIEEIIENNLDARNNDSILYAMVCERLNDNVKRYSFSDVMRNRVYFGLPDYETVRRHRCRIVSLRKELMCLPGVRTNRGKHYKTYLDYAKI